MLRVKDASKDTFIPVQTNFLKNKEYTDDMSDNNTTPDEVSTDADQRTKERAEDITEERNNPPDHASDDEQESCENIQYNLIMPEQETYLQESMLEDTSVDTGSITVQEYTQVANEANDTEVARSSSCTEQQWRTKLGGTLASILGNTDDVIEFDRARKNAKTRRQDKFLLDNYMHKLAVIQTRLSKKKRELEKDIEDWEKNYFNLNNNLPTYDDLIADSVMKDKLKQIKTAKVIMKLKG